MSKDACTIKGGRQGLSLSIPEGLEFTEAIAQLRAKLTSAQQFFSGATVSLTAETRELDPTEKEELARTVEEFGVVLDPTERKKDKQPETEQRERSSAAGMELEIPQENTVLLRRTLRSGQRVHYDGNVVVVGDVNPGAEIVCGGDILVLGSLRGMAHAGSQGNWKATVFAFRLEPTQLRIAHYISRSPDGNVPRPTGPELAKVSENMIEITAYS